MERGWDDSGATKTRSKFRVGRGKKGVLSVLPIYTMLLYFCCSFSFFLYSVSFPHSVYKSLV